MKELFYVIWVIYVTVVCIVGFFANPGLVEFLVTGFMWMVMIIIPGAFMDEK
jgi:hypothetical protein